MIQFCLVFAGVSGGLSVALGAFGAHALRGSIEPRLMETFQTGVQYQMSHSLALLMLALMMHNFGRSLAFDISVYAMILGIIMFSGSLYGLVMTDLKAFGPITPLGGLSLIIGWIALVVGCLQRIS